MTSAEASQLRRVRRAALTVCVLAACCALPSCRKPQQRHEPPEAGPSAAPSSAEVPPPQPPAIVATPSDPMLLHAETKDALLALFELSSSAAPRRHRDPQDFLLKNFGPGTPSLSNQGNKSIAHHVISREQCMQGLQGLTLQTEDQRRLCRGQPNMVPVYGDGNPASAKVCIDIFEFPNRPCELPFVWISPAQASITCELQGKRLCTQQEWSTACAADPSAGAPSLYAYGPQLDLAACNTNKSAPKVNEQKCDPDSSRTAWQTCSTNTEPAGAFPACRSRLGVFDLHGNVAEIMTRLDPDGLMYSQLKGSAFFYVDVARKHDERPARNATHETYPDHCAFDPRWHVEPMTRAWHVNYHLGFRCCLGLP
jgi:formylglycine-generating enzyme